MKESSRFEVWKSDLAIAAYLRSIHGLNSSGLFHRALKAYCQVHKIDWDSIKKQCSVPEEVEPLNAAS